MQKSVLPVIKHLQEGYGNHIYNDFEYELHHVIKDLNGKYGIIAIKLPEIA